MHDLDTIKRLNRNPSKRFERDNPAPQPTRAESRTHRVRANIAAWYRRREMQSPAMDREPLGE